MPSTPAVFRARAVHSAQQLLEYANVSATVVDRDADDPAPDIATSSAFVAVTYAALSHAPRRLRDAQARARAAGDGRPVVLVQGFESSESRGDLVALMTVDDIGRLLGAVQDAQEVPA